MLSLILLKSINDMITREIAWQESVARGEPTSTPEPVLVADHVQETIQGVEVAPPKVKKPRAAKVPAIYEVTPEPEVLTPEPVVVPVAPVAPAADLAASVKAAIVALAGRDKAQTLTIIKSVGAERFSEILPTKYVEVLAKLKAALDGDELV